MAGEFEQSLSYYNSVISKNPEFVIRKMVSRHKNLSTKTLIQMAKDDFEVFDPIEFLNSALS